MSSAATLVVQSTAESRALYMALELSNTTWKVLFASGAGNGGSGNVKRATPRA